MTDLEITKLCAAAMGYTPEVFDGNPNRWRLRDVYGDCVYTMGERGIINRQYEPLENDAQAMALLRSQRLNIIAAGHPAAHWIVTPLKAGMQASGPDLSRAICECVAKMQAAK